MLKEEWKDIEGWEGYYAVSSLGRVWSVKRKIFKSLDDSNRGGYLRVQLCNNQKTQKYFVHRLVAKAFVPGYFEGADVNHKDFCRSNNCKDNLEWVTKSENSLYTTRAGRMTGAFKEKPYKLILADGNVLFFPSMRSLAKSIGYSKSFLYSCLKTNSGYIRQINGTVLPCESNDYPYRSSGKCCEKVSAMSQHGDDIV